VGRDFPRRLELSFTKPENVANQAILTPKIIAAIPFGVQAMAEANESLRKAGAQPTNAFGIFESRSFCLVEDLPGVASSQRAVLGAVGSRLKHVRLQEGSISP
jgi:hypothetical protein